ncbi:Uncharacterised protein [Mycobacterium tuberculosis]|uniref:Uncharacterized protein n=1 Tax=Mycobacterium tuberculosis TaxID=1773 RepID=A0A916LEZ2_MYCTX|nr:Uncharacterised protein [Mycobacterium tuberculosis]
MHRNTCLPRSSVRCAPRPVAAEYTVRAATSATAPATVMPPTCAPIDTAYAGMP